MKKQTVQFIIFQTKIPETSLQSKVYYKFSADIRFPFHPVRSHVSKCRQVLCLRRPLVVNYSSKLLVKERERDNVENSCLYAGASIDSAYKANYHDACVFRPRC